MADENKDLIIDGAIGLFAKKGYEGVGVQEICETAGITKPTLYYYFKSKQGLLEAIAAAKGEQLFNVISEALVYEHDFIKSLTAVLKAEINFAQNNKEFFNLHTVLINAPEGSEERAVYSVIINKIEACFEDFFINSTNEFGNMKEKESLYSEMFHTMALSAARKVLEGKLEFTEQVVFQIIHSFVYGVAN